MSTIQSHTPLAATRLRQTRRKFLGALLVLSSTAVGLLQACGTSSTGAPTTATVAPTQQAPAQATQAPVAAPTQQAPAAQATQAPVAAPTQAAQAAAPTTAVVAPAPTQPAVTQATTIVFWHWKFGQPSFKGWTDWLKTAYAKVEPNVTLQYFQPGDINTQVKTAIASGGKLPDLVGVSGDEFDFEMSAAGNWLDLKPHIDQDSEWQGWIKGWGAVPQVQYVYQGKIVNLNISNGPNFVYYWKDLLQKAGVDVPQTLDDMALLVPKLKAIGVDTMVSGLDSTSLGNYDIWLWNLAGLINYDWAGAKQANSCATHWAGDPVAKQTMDLFDMLYKEGVIRRQSPQEKYDPDAKQAFNQRKAAFFFPAGVWINGGLGQSIDNVGAMFLPGLKAGARPVLMGSNDVAVAVLTATPQQKNPQRVASIVQLCKFMTSPDSQKQIWSVGLMPLMPEAVGTENTGSQKLTADQVKLANTPGSGTLYYATSIPELANAQENSMLGLLIGNKTTDQVLADSDAGCAKVKKS